MIAYAITDPRTLNFQTLEQDIKRFSQKADMIVYRDKANVNYEDNAKEFMVEARKYSFDKILLHTDYTLAHKLKADGVHLKSTQFDAVVKAKALGLFVVISTHTFEEALQAQNLGTDMITFSPIFSTPNKGEAKGVGVLKKLVSILDIPVIALGGIVTQAHIGLCEVNGSFGFASIRYFV
jgi:thiamine-phosphate pyrophosphorylase